MEIIFMNYIMTSLINCNIIAYAFPLCSLNDSGV